MRIVHNIKPIFDKDSKILILGSLPSPRSRESGMFYAHPQNRFWKVLAEIFNEQFPVTNKDKKDFLLRHRIAVWDVVKVCDIDGASDNSIKNVEINNFSFIFKTANIKAVFTTGRAANRLYKKYTGNDAIYLPSTSPTNCAMSFDLLVENFKIILNYLND